MSRSTGVVMLTLVPIAFTGSMASASFVIDVVVDGSSSAVVSPGSIVRLDLAIHSDAGAEGFNSAIVRLNFSAEGLSVLGYEWAAPFQAGSIFDDSKPGAGRLPSIITADLLAGPGYEPGVIDIELSNVAEVGRLLVGPSPVVFASVEVQVPADWTGAPRILVEAAPDTLADGFVVRNARAGGGLELAIVPAPGCGLLAGLALTLAGRRRARPWAACPGGVGA